MKNIYATLFFLAFLTSSFAQSFTSYFTGDTTDVSTAHMPGLVLAGGGGDNDDAMKWMLNRAAGGDVVIIRASGSDGYNEYFFSELGVNVNSVETILFNSVDAASDPYVIAQIENAEVLFIAGGDQYDYYSFWKDNAIEDAINFLLNEKMATVGGTSAGMAILGNAYYTPPGGSATAEELLADPFHPDAEILGYNDFVENPYLPALITDTHFDQRDRAGRLMVFLARLSAENEIQTFGISCNEYTAVCVDGDGIGQVFGEWPEYDDYAYFLTMNCQDESLPEVMEQGVSFTWNRGQAAVKSYRLPGIISGGNTFDLLNWEPVGGGEWFDWYVDNGELFQAPDADPACDAFTSQTWESEKSDWKFTISPNPVGDHFFIQTDGTVERNIFFEIYTPLGKMIESGQLSAEENQVKMNDIAPGGYFIRIKNGNEIGRSYFLKI